MYHRDPITQKSLINQEVALASEKCCGDVTVQALVRVDDRGQMVLPKDVREKAEIRGGDKLALTTIEKDGKVCCILLTRSDDFVQVVRATLGEAASALIRE